jgi:PKD repeat protein
MGAMITPVIAASEGSGITEWILTTQDIQRLLPGYEVYNGEKQGNTVGFHVEGMYPWVNSYFSEGDVSLAGYTIVSNKWMALKRNSEGYGVKVINIDYSVFSYWDSPTRDQVMQRITGSMPFHQKYGSSKSIQLGNAGRAYITPVYDSATVNVYHIEFSKGYVYATLNVQIPKDQTGEALSIRIAEELEKKIPATTTVLTPTPVRASFSVSPQSGVAPLTVTFTDTSGGNPVSRLWKFHDGQTFTSNNVRFTYNTPGSYMVYLTVTGSDGSTSTVTTRVKVLTSPTETPTVTVKPVPPPVARIYASTTTGDAPLRVQFVDHSSGSISTRLWNFGDGYRSEISEPNHTFQKAGTYTVKLTVNGAGGSDTEILVINVGGATIGPTVTSEVITPISPGPSRTEVPITPTVTATTVNTGEGDHQDTGTKVADSTIAAVVAVAGAAAAAGVAAGAAGGGTRPPGETGEGSFDSDEYNRGLEAERISQMQEDYKNALEQVEFLRSHKLGYEKEGFSSKERDNEIAYWESQAGHLKDQLDREGAGISYSPRERGEVGPDKAFVQLGEKTRNLREIDKVTEARRQKYKEFDEAMEKQRDQIQKNIADNDLWNYNYGSMTWDNIKRDFCEAGDELTDINNWKAFVQGFVLDTGKELAGHPVDSFVKTVDASELILEDMAKHPVNTAVLLTSGFDMKGVITSTDYDKPLLSRVGTFFLSTGTAGRGLKLKVEPIEATSPKIRLPEGVEMPTAESIPPVKPTPTVEVPVPDKPISSVEPTPTVKPVSNLQGKMKEILEGKEGKEYDNTVIDDKDRISLSSHTDSVSTESVSRRAIMYEGSPNVRAVVLGRDGAVKYVVPAGTEHIDVKLKPNEVMMIVDREKNAITDRTTINQDWVLNPNERARLDKIAKDAIEKSLKK